MQSENKRLKPYNFSSEFSFVLKSDVSGERDDEFEGVVEGKIKGQFGGEFERELQDAANITLAPNVSRAASVYDFNEVRLQPASMKCVIFVLSVRRIFYLTCRYEIRLW